MSQDLLILTPHSSGAVPASVLHAMLGDRLWNTAEREALLRRLFLDGDPYTDLIFLVPGARTLNAPWSRFVVDLNRERDDRSDNGVVKRGGFDRQPLYPEAAQPDHQEMEARLRRYWDTFERQVTAELPGARLMIVGHCMAAFGPKLGPDEGRPRPALTLMVGEPDQPTFPPSLVPALQQAAQQAFADVLAGAAVQEVAVGVPWASDTLSLQHSRRSGVPAFGLEVNAGLYLNAQGEPDDAALQGLNAAFRQFAQAALQLL
ncbi:N-formylglutamate amidohydrolase [Deinococcus sonorensis]|uniref:N-formylglutamate amidohydrolase n=2 Tax=Deinococcus sonorensis TaxID=309891 RepID=A0AAU7UFC4_9DEIO